MVGFPERVDCLQEPGFVFAHALNHFVMPMTDFRAQKFQLVFPLFDDGMWAALVDVRHDDLIDDTAGRAQWYWPVLGLQLLGRRSAPGC